MTCAQVTELYVFPANRLIEIVSGRRGEAETRRNEVVVMGIYPSQDDASFRVGRSPAHAATDLNLK